VPSELHEDLVDAIADAILWGRVADELLHDVALIRDAKHAAPFVGVPAMQRRADLYIIPGDLPGPIFVEVGGNPPGKWADITVSDGRPARVLRVGWEREVSLLYPRETDVELSIMRAVQLWLTDPAERERLHALHALGYREGAA
jgi:hypothetical protein